MEELRNENRRRLWNSLEMGDVKRNILVIVVMLPLFYAVGAGRIRDPEGKLVMIALTAAIVLPFLIFYLVRMLRILHRAEKYVFCRTVLSKPHTSLNHRLFYFSVVLKDAQGKEFMADTHAIFGTRNIFGLQMENYVNQTVMMAYNPATGMVVVIG